MIIPDDRAGSGTVVSIGHHIKMEGCDLKEPVFQGSCTAMITPFTADGIDFARMKKQLDFQADNGTKAVVIAGTTGEIATLTDREYEALAVFCIRECAGRMKAILGVGGNCTEKCLENAKFAAAAGADAVLMTPPYYNKTSDEGLTEHFLYVADRCDVPVILYNVPSRTSIGLSAKHYRILAEHPNINGVKEASGDFDLIGQIASECAEKLWIWSGNDAHTIPMIALGAQGVVSVASNLIPAETAKLCGLCLQGHFTEACALFRRSSPLFRALFIETNPIPVKAAMQRLGMDSGLLRRPLVPITQEHFALLEQSMEKAGLLN